MGEFVLKLTPLAAVLGSVALSFFFVASLYLWRLVGYRDVNRDATDVIQRRFLSAVLSCLCSALLLWSFARPAAENAEGLSLMQLLGIQSEDSFRACINCVGVTASLFIGPLVQHLVSYKVGASPLCSLPGGRWVALRNLILAPLTEEFVFRACLVRLWVSASFPTVLVIFCSPLCFALAHTHHFIEHVRRFTNKQHALQIVAFQVFYTSLFGMYSNFLLFRTGSTVALILCHTFCNWQGFPDLGFLVSRQHPLHDHRAWLGVVYIIGVGAFCRNLFPMTAGFSSSFGG